MSKKKTPTYTDEQVINEVIATMALEDMPLSEDDIAMLRDVQSKKYTADEARQRILSQTK